MAIPATVLFCVRSGFLVIKTTAMDTTNYGGSVRKKFLTSKLTDIGSLQATRRSLNTDMVQDDYLVATTMFENQNPTVAVRRNLIKDKRYPDNHRNDINNVKDTADNRLYRFVDGYEKFFKSFTLV